jgi:predicted nucleic acid-binding protein
MSIFIDTSGFIAMLDADDAFHAMAAKTWIDILTSQETLVTTNYILLETCAIVQHRLGTQAVKLFQEDVVPVLSIHWIDKTMHHAAISVMLSTGRKKLSLVDCVSFAVMRFLGITTVFTFDKHFKEQEFNCIST